MGWESNLNKYIEKDTYDRCFYKETTYSLLNIIPTNYTYLQLTSHIRKTIQYTNIDICKFVLVHYETGATSIIAIFFVLYCIVQFIPGWVILK